LKFVSPSLTKKLIKFALVISRSPDVMKLAGAGDDGLGREGWNIVAVGWSAGIRGGRSVLSKSGSMRFGMLILSGIYEVNSADWDESAEGNSEKRSANSESTLVGKNVFKGSNSCGAATLMGQSMNQSESFAGVNAVLS
jgi:hypothetical protein